MLELTVTHEQPENAATPITILHLDGKLDGSNFESFIDRGQALYAAGTRDLLIDMENLAFISSAGISALHRVVLIFQGKKAEDLEEGWRSYRSIGEEKSAVQKRIKLLNPSANVRNVLDKVGFIPLFEIYDDLGKAIESFVTL